MIFAQAPSSMRDFCVSRRLSVKMALQSILVVGCSKLANITLQFLMDSGILRRTWIMVYSILLPENLKLPFKTREHSLFSLIFIKQFLGAYFWSGELFAPHVYCSLKAYRRVFFKGLWILGLFKVDATRQTYYFRCCLNQIYFMFLGFVSNSFVSLQSMHIKYNTLNCQKNRLHWNTKKYFNSLFILI